MKVVGWERNLIEFIGQAARMDFQPSVLDCGFFLNDGVKAMTGVDHFGKHRGKYKTIPRGLAILRKMGFKDHVEYVASLFEELPSVLHAQRGDAVVAVDQVGEPALGIVQGEKAYFMTLSGLTLVPLTDCIRAFRI